MGYRNRACSTFQLLPIIYVAKKNIYNLLLGELQITTRFVVSNGNGTTNHWNLNYTAINLGSLCRLDGLVCCTEINGSSNKLTNARARADTLIINLTTTLCVCEIRKPALINRSWEGCAGTTDGGLSN